MGGAVEPHRQAGQQPLGGLRGDDALAQSLTFTGEVLPPRFNLARYCLSGKPQEKTALIVAGRDTETLELWRARGRGAAAGRRLPPVRRRTG
jgi:hypothetical protein